MALIVEDGTQVENANAYANLATIKAFAASRGVDLTDDAEIEKYNAFAIDYLEGKRDQYEGSKVSSLQELQFPRIELYIDGFEFPSNAIPKELIKANCQLIIEQKLGVNLMPTQSEPIVKAETVGQIKTEYAVNPGALNEPYISSVDLLLKPLFKTGGNGFSLSVVRI